MEQLKAEAQAWTEIDPCEETRERALDAINGDDEAALRDAFGTRIQFGTAGLRAEMSYGPAKMNDLVIIQTAQGLCTYLIDQLGEAEACKRGIVLGFDHRKRGQLNSERFALLTAAVCLSRSMKVYLFGEFVATPFVPFAIKELNAAAGVMVTASHNPKNDNGFKVYWGNACQIIPPHDAGIAKSIGENLKPWEESYEGVTVESVRSNSLCEDPLSQIEASYFETVASKLCRFKEENSEEASSVRCVYTAMHGIGHRYAKLAFEAFGHNAFCGTPEQIEPDPEFPTVAFPNPEEGKGALALAMSCADKNNCDLILANDPDADRLAVAERSSDGWKIFSGNEIATLLGNWQWVNYSKKGGSKGAAMVASTVSSKMLRVMGDKEGFHFAECLTGFKWIGNKSLELREQGYDVIFSYEEAIGFCLDDIVPDKDGVSAMTVFAEMAGQLKKQGKTCAEHLTHLNETYGYLMSNNGYVISQDTALNMKVFKELNKDGEYPKSLVNGKYEIVAVRDLLAPGFDSSTTDKVPTLPVGSSPMITFEFGNGAIVTLRASGTEPKVKWYSELRATDPKEGAAELDALIEDGIKGELLRELISK